MVKFGCSGGVARAWRGREAGVVDTMDTTALKFEKDGWLYERASGAPKSIPDENLRKLAQDRAWKSKKRTPPCARGFCVGINIIYPLWRILRLWFLSTDSGYYEYTNHTAKFFYHELTSSCIRVTKKWFLSTFRLIYITKWLDAICWLVISYLFNK